VQPELQQEVFVSEQQQEELLFALVLELPLRETSLKEMIVFDEP
jgi:hypothetical protein